MDQYNLNYLEELEAESMHIIRETCAEFKNPVMLYSIGKDSSVLLHLARKAFYPSQIPFPLLHIDTGFKFREMIEFRDYFTKKVGARLIVKKNEEIKASSMLPEQAHTDEYIYYKKTKPLLEALKENKFDASFGGARRDEEQSRSKERIFSVRDQNNVWDPKNQRPELWHTYNTQLSEGQTIRVFPLSNWNEIDVWLYIQKENIEVVPLYFAKKIKTIQRNGVYLRLDEFVTQKPGEQVSEGMFRYRTLGCSPSTGAVPSSASNLEEIIKELIQSRYSERQNRAIDYGSASMESKKKEGYF